jgi:hypothetical protein
MPIPADWSERLKAYVSKWKSAGSPQPEEYLGNRPFKNFVLTEHASSWDKVADWITEFDGRWCFRGQREVSWFLDTSLDRAVSVTYSGRNHSGYYHLDREQGELVLRFRVATACICRSGAIACGLSNLAERCPRRRLLVSHQ